KRLSFQSYLTTHICDDLTSVSTRHIHTKESCPISWGLDANYYRFESFHGSHLFLLGSIYPLALL
ncbi:MAG: hypothetical protein WAJ93_19955, partial [Candidatus Nitrosopolaris sp.]